jgi:hypothetical protein
MNPNEKLQRKLVTLALIVLVLLLCFADSFAQPFIGIAATNKGIPVSIGALIDKVEIKGTYIRPFKNNPSVSSLTLGYQINLTNDEKDNYSITPSIGYSNVRWKDFSQYDKEDIITQVNEFHPAYGLELGKDLFLGRFYLSGNYYNAFYLSVGIKAYFRYNQLQKLK